MTTPLTTKSEKKREKVLKSSDLETSSWRRRSVVCHVHNAPSFFEIQFQKSDINFSEHGIE